MAIVWGDYETAFPVTVVHKAGIPQVIQPIFTREFKVLGKKVKSNDIVEFLRSNYKNIDIRIEECIQQLTPKKRVHQILNLDVDFEKNYSKNAKRLIKKSNDFFSFEIITDLSAFFRLIEETLVPKINEFNSENIAKLHSLMGCAQGLGKAVCISIKDENSKFVGAGFFFQHQKKITYLKGAATDAAKKKGAMFGLINYAFNFFVRDFTVFDFGGSNLENVAGFYRKFGATDRIYYHYELNTLPFWYRWTKKHLKKT